MSPEEYLATYKRQNANKTLVDVKAAYQTLLSAERYYPTNGLFKYLIALKLLEMSEFEKALAYFKAANQFDNDIPPSERMELGYIKALMACGNMTDANYQINKAAIELKNNKRNQVDDPLNVLYEQYNRVVRSMNLEANMAVERLEGNINTTSSDFSCAIGKTGKDLFFNRQPSKFMQLSQDSSNNIQIFVAGMVRAGEWGKASLIYPSGEEDELNKVSLQVIENENDNRNVSLLVTREGNLSYLDKQDGVWKDMGGTGFERVINKRLAKEVSANIAKNGKTIVFASDQAGEGDMDLFIAELKLNYVWGGAEPIDVLNTEYNETSPYLSEDGKRLYFSSQRPSGFGGYDIYYTDYNSEKKAWSAPELMPYPINSVADDVYFVPTSSNISYLSSDRAGGMGGFDIYRVYMYSKLNVKGVIKDRDSNAPIKDALIQITESDKLVKEAKTDEKGFYSLELPIAKKLKIRVLLDKKVLYQQYLNIDSKLIYAKTSQELTNNFFVRRNPDSTSIDFSKLGNKEVFTLRQIRFESGSAKLLPSSFEELERIHLAMIRNPELKLQIIGHTDNQGDSLTNERLSLERAQAVVRYIVDKKQVNEDRFMAIGKGGRSPIFSNDDEKDGRELNRRIEACIWSSEETEQD